MKKNFTIWFVALQMLCHFLLAQNNTPPSCVITAPHSNAYFQVGKAMTIRVYATDIGGTYTGGSVSKVEFFNGSNKLGEATTATNNTYTYVWNNLLAGSYTITAKATDNAGKVSTSAGVLITVGTNAVTSRGMSACKGKYLANIIAGSVPANYLTYWNGVTAENGSKWGTVEGSRDNMNWGQSDISYNHAKNNNLMFRYHAIAWGSQYPSWITNLSVADFKAEMIEYMDAIKTRYPYTDQVDVLNEQLGTHAGGTNYFRDGLGGNGSTGYDWQIWLFEQARQRFPNTKLVLNDYGLENDQNAINQMLGLVKVLRDRNLIDGFGTQAHEFNINTLSASAMKSSLDLMAKSGVPVFVTELDISGDDNAQKTRYQTLFPVYYEHPAVAGITLWGYIDGQTWKANTGLVSSASANPTESPAMQWIKQYMTARTDVKYPYCTQNSENVTAIEEKDTDAMHAEALNFHPNPFSDEILIEVLGDFAYSVYSISGIELSNGFANGSLKLGRSLPQGSYVVRIHQANQTKTIKILKY
jgi:GH35 family endo-1,4-beta-xylanase